MHAQAVTHVSWRAKQLGKQLGISKDEEDQWQLLQEGACSSGFVSAMSVEGAKDSKRGYVSKLQVCCCTRFTALNVYQASEAIGLTGAC